MKFKYIVLIVVFCFTLFFASCKINCKERVKVNEAKELAQDFFMAIENNNFVKAESYLHPIRTFNLEKSFNQIEQELNIDFQSGIYIVRYSGFEQSVYSSEIDGSKCEIDMVINVGDVKKIEVSIEVVRNSIGYGIYDIEIDL